MLLAVLYNLRCPRCLHQALLQWVGESQFVHLWLCSPPCNGCCQTSGATPLYFHLSLNLAAACTCCSWRRVCPPILRTAELSACYTTTLLLLQSAGAASLKGWGEVIMGLGLHFLPGNDGCHTLCSISAHGFSCMQYVLVTQARMLLLPHCSAGLQNVYTVTCLFLFLSPLELQWDLGCICGTCSSPFPPLLCPPSDVSMRGSLRHVCAEQGLFCWIIVVQLVIFKGRDLEDLSQCHAAHVTKKYILKTQNKCTLFTNLWCRTKLTLWT